MHASILTKRQPLSCIHYHRRPRKKKPSGFLQERSQSQQCDSSSSFLTTAFSFFFSEAQYLLHTHYMMRSSVRLCVCVCLNRCASVSKYEKSITFLELLSDSSPHLRIWRRTTSLHIDQQTPVRLEEHLRVSPHLLVCAEARITHVNARINKNKRYKEKKKENQTAFTSHSTEKHRKQR
jgi:hypothetical protein